MWTAVVVVFLGGALGLSFLAQRDPDDPAPTGDTTEFCRRIGDYDRDRSLPSSEDTPAALGRLASDLAAAEQVAEDAIRPSVTDIRAGVEEVAADTATRSTDPGASAALAGVGLAERVESRTKRSFERLSRYVKKACAIDLSPVTAEPSPSPASR